MGRLSYWFFCGSYSHGCMYCIQVTTTAVLPLDHRKPWLGRRHTPCQTPIVSSVGAGGPGRNSVVLASDGSATSTAVWFAVIPVRHLAAMCCPGPMHRISVHVFALSVC